MFYWVQAWLNCQQKKKSHKISNATPQLDMSLKLNDTSILQVFFAS